MPVDCEKWHFHANARSAAMLTAKLQRRQRAASFAEAMGFQGTRKSTAMNEMQRAEP
jgi:hypothetical protein